MPNRAIVFGASGLIGRHLVNNLLKSEQYSVVRVFVRRSLEINDPKLMETILGFDNITEQAQLIIGDVVFSCMGTTLSQVSDQSEYRKIDHDYPLTLAKVALQNGASQFHVVTSIGADVNSSTTYLKLKGELEANLQKLGYPAIYIYRPSFLSGERKKVRVLEKIMGPIMNLLSPVMIGALKNYRPIKAETVAKVMFQQSLTNARGVFIYSSNQIQNLA